MKAGLDKSFIGEYFAAHISVVEQSAALLEEQAKTVAAVLIEALEGGKKVIAFGNGGSATQASHLAGELIGRFSLTRQPFPAITLASDTGTVTCIANDFGYEFLFARQVEALAQAGDVVVGFTTSGRSENVVRGLAAAKEKDAVTVALTGAAGLSGGIADYTLTVPSDVTAHIQEVHLMLLHVWCIGIDEALGRAV